MFNVTINMSNAKDFIGTLKGLQLVAEASLQLHSNEIKRIWRNSSIPPIISQYMQPGVTVSQLKTEKVVSNLSESMDRAAAVAAGLKAYAINVGATSGTKHSNLRNDVWREEPTKSYYEIKLTESDRKLLEKLDSEHRQKLRMEQQHKVDNTNQYLNRYSDNQQLNEQAKQRKVPSSRFGRILSFGSLAAGLGIGTAAEYARRTFGLAGEAPPDPSTLFLTPANLDRIVDTLCKVRGAALKLGQILSIQDESIVNPQLSKALERVRKSADFMPQWQVEDMLIQELGSQWRQKLLTFEERPFAAASIGQVHRAKITGKANFDGNASVKTVAIKIQYPGVARGIESDIDNLGAIMKLWNAFPKGMFMENLMNVAKRELTWEVDYRREAECTRRFKQLLVNYPYYYVPDVIDELSTHQVFTTEFLHGVPVDQCFDMSEEDRHFIGDKIMELCLLEMLKFRYMQTDPNWANFLYDCGDGNSRPQRIMLLDFGASRSYSREFMDQYVTILKAACDGDRSTVLRVSQQLGFLTGYESKLMEEAHVDAVMILGEVFRCPNKYDFSLQNMTRRIQNLVPTMVSHRLCPPPEEVYSLHRKLSGVFLLCSKLRVKIACRDKFLNLYNDYVCNKSS